MKKFYFLAVFFLSVGIFAQDELSNTVVEKEGNLLKVSMYHDNGQLAQQGFLKNNKLHGKWVRYAQDGSQQCIAFYKKGKREGTWLFWNDDQLTQVEFKENAIVRELTWESSSKIVSAQ